MAFRKKWHLTDKILCSRDFDQETGKLHVKNHSEKWGGLGG